MKRDHHPSLTPRETGLKEAAARRRVPLVMMAVTSSVAIFVAYPGPARAGLTCGIPPQLSTVGIKEQVETDAKAKAGLLLSAPPKTDVRKLATTLRREMRRKFATLDKSVLDRYFLFATCQDITDDPELAESQVYDVYSDFYRILSEPIDKADAAAE
jgi:hypothetical protein